MRRREARQTRNATAPHALDRDTLVPGPPLSVDRVDDVSIPKGMNPCFGRLRERPIDGSGEKRNVSVGLALALLPRGWSDDQGQPLEQLGELAPVVVR